MSRHPLRDSFAHHVWATVQLIEACRALSHQQLETSIPGTYGSILETVRHLVGVDSWYLFVATGDRQPLPDAEPIPLQELAAAMQSQGEAWLRLVTRDLDPDLILREVDDEDGFERHAPMGIQIAQALHHGADHRSQICTAPSVLGVKAPAIDVWTFGRLDGRVVEIAPPS